MESQTLETVRKIPLLGDIPLLGHAFKRTIQEDIKKELMIFLTPYIVSTASDLEAASRTEVRALQLADDAFPPGEIDKYLDGDIKQELYDSEDENSEPGEE